MSVVSDEAGADNSTNQRPKRKQVGRPFQKGVSGNPGGRPAELREVVELARAHTAEAIQRLVEWARSDHPSASPKACEVLIDRGWGKPVQPNEHTGKDGGPIQTQAVTDERPPLDQFLAEFRAAREQETKH